MKDAARERKPGISGNTLKMIAVIAMLIDHIGAAVIEAGVMGGLDAAGIYDFVATPEGSRIFLIDIVLRSIGRIAFPVYCFLLVEGFLHTRDVKKYMVRLFAFALISEIPFDLAFSTSWIDPVYQNVYVTLFLGLLVLAGLERFRGLAVWQVFTAAAGCLAAALLRTDYGAVGALMILTLYMFRRDKKRQVLFGGLMALAESAGNMGAAALAFIPISLYNGERGKTNLKYFFYWFYPVHLVCLILVRRLLFP